jgi:hypothetical protein
MEPLLAVSIGVLVMVVVGLGVVVGARMMDERRDVGDTQRLQAVQLRFELLAQRAADWCEPVSLLGSDNCPWCGHRTFHRRGTDHV